LLNLSLFAPDLVATAEPVNLEPLILVSVLLAVVVIHLASRLMGEISVRMGFPSVLGELIGGVLVGSSVLGLLIFQGGTSGEELLPLAESSQLIQFLERTTGVSGEAVAEVFSAQSEIINILSELGVIILLFEIGLESDLGELIRVGPQAAVVALIGVVVPFVGGTLGLIYLFDIPSIPAIFAGAALTATSIGITARVLAEMRQLSSPEGQVIIGAAVLDDVLGIIILAVVAGLARTGEVVISDIAWIAFSAVAFLVGSIVVGRLLSPYLVSLIDNLKTRGNPLIPGLIIAFVLSYVAQVIQLEAILGAFAAGLILGETQKRGEFEEQVRPLSDLFTPIFFVCVGAKTNLAVLDPRIPANQEGLIIAAFLIVVAMLGKLAAGLGAFGKPGINKLAIGVGMIPRGEVGLVFAGVGAASGVLSDSLGVSIIVMVIVTTFVAPLWLRGVFSRPEHSQESDQGATVAEGIPEDADSATDLTSQQLALEEGDAEMPSLADLQQEVVTQDAAASGRSAKGTSVLEPADEG